MPAKGRNAPARTQPVYYSLVVPGLEDLAAAELKAAGATVQESLTRIDKREGIVLFRIKDVAQCMHARTIEDVFQVVLDVPTATGRRGPNQLARQLERGPLERALSTHNGLRRGKHGRSYRVISRVSGRHAFQRNEISRAFSTALDRLLSKWVAARTSAALELWVHVVGDRTIAGVRLSDDTLAGRRYKRAHLPASLKPTVARALVRLADVRTGQTVLDPMCGAGTILREAAEEVRRARLLGGDLDAEAREAARTNTGKLAEVVAWDACRLPVRGSSVDAVITNPPYGRQHEAAAGLTALYRSVAREWSRVLRPDGRAVILTGEPARLLEALPRTLHVQSRRRLLLRGLPVTAFVIVRV